MVRGESLVIPNPKYTIPYIKNKIKNLKEHPVQWDKSRGDGRKKKIFNKGIIYNTYKHHFTIKTEKYITSFCYVDLYLNNVKLLSVIDGENILKENRKRGGN